MRSNFDTQSLLFSSAPCSRRIAPAKIDTPAGDVDAI
jgi:hypothetical protein